MPPTFEELDVDRGLVRYAVTVPGPRQPYPLSVRGLRDLAVVYVDGVRAGVLGEDEDRARGAGRGARARGAVGGVPGAGQLRSADGRAEGHHRRACCTSASICTAYGRAGCGWTRSEPRRSRGPRLPGRSPATGCPGSVPGRRHGRAAPGTPAWNCRAGPGASCGSTASAWAVTGPRGRSGSLYVPGPVLREGTNEVWVLELDQASVTPPVLRPVPANPAGENPPASP